MTNSEHLRHSGRRADVKAVLTMAHDVFISHSSVDKVAADAACAALEARGIRCWIAPRDIKPSDSWAGAIVEAIRGARIFLLVFSSHANRSTQVTREVTQAANSGKQLLTLRIEDVQPANDLNYYLLDRHWLDAVTPPFSAHLEKLADACTGLLALPDAGPQPVSGNPALVPSALRHPTPVPVRQTWWQHRPVKAALIAVVIVVLGAVTGITGYLLRPSQEHDDPAPSPTASAPTVPSVAAPPTSSMAAPLPAPAPAVPTAPLAALGPFVGSWSGMRETVDISADGSGNYHYMLPCSGCTMAETPYGNLSFALTSVSGDTASGTVTEADTGETDLIGDPIAITLEPPSGGPTTITVSVNGGGGPLMCPQGDAAWCGG